jgi:hypothetical protein
LGGEPFLGVGQHFEAEQLGQRVIQSRRPAVEDPTQFVVREDRPPQFQWTRPAQVVGTVDPFL